ncbi:hypothetical protein BURK2_01764 [Burkholderiales bacterium]|nr:MAG: hypothetical protein F9K47_18555 [Burkholderiales bacterium]CAG0979598.1 hypothetical protein BURK2_01764 [Burkholderiales bacterium]
MPHRTPTPASRAAAAASVSLVAVLACLGYLIFKATLDGKPQPFILVLVALALSSAIVLHLVFVGLLARRTGRSAIGYVVGALLTLPIGSIVGLILYEWHTETDAASSPTPASSPPPPG